MLFGDFERKNIIKKGQFDTRDEDRAIRVGLSSEQTVKFSSEAAK